MLEGGEDELVIKLLKFQTWYQLRKTRCSLARRKHAVKTSPIEATVKNMKNGLIISE